LQIQLPEHQPSDDVYFALLESIVSQQLSVKAADTIFRRFLLLFDNGYPDAGKLMHLDETTLRSAGLSGQKVAYLQNVARFSLESGLSYEKISALTDEELLAYLTQIKGVGKWTVEMLMMFVLQRPDVFPVDDLGIQNAMKKIYGLTGTGKELKTKMLATAEAWRPHRTLACRYLWRWKDANVGKL
jgi:DNA-3-methyladenine glycosylase II